MDINPPYGNRSSRKIRRPGTEYFQANTPQRWPEKWQAYHHGIDSKNTKDIRFEYLSGSLENSKIKDSKELKVLYSQGIREHVCELLEGGSDAFKKREKQYSL